MIHLSRSRAQLARFGFSQDRALTIVASLSGGEKARLLFALMTADRPHILLLDEPTNHLDVDSRQALIQAINAFAGAVVIVSHDPHVIKLTANRFWLVADGTVAPFDGDLQDYRDLLLAGSGNGKRPDTGTGGTPSLQPKSKRDQRRRAAAQRRALAPLRRDLEHAERTVERLTARKAELDQAMAAPDLYDGGGEKAVVLQRELREVTRDLTQAEARWLQLQEQWETAPAA